MYLYVYMFVEYFVATIYSLLIKISPRADIR